MVEGLHQKGRIVAMFFFLTIIFPVRVVRVPSPSKFSVSSDILFLIVYFISVTGLLWLVKKVNPDTEHIYFVMHWAALVNNKNPEMNAALNDADKVKKCLSNGILWGSGLGLPCLGLWSDMHCELPFYTIEYVTAGLQPDSSNMLR